jgi:predicted metal-dependent hydrolase
MPEKEIWKLLEKEKEKSELEWKSKDELVQELNQLSNNFEKNKSRMVEIAKVLLARHYGYERKKNKKSD